MRRIKKGFVCVENKARVVLGSLVQKFGAMMMEKEEGIDGILVTVGLCIIALLLCVVMKNSLTTFIQNIVSSLTTSANNILAGVGK